MSKMPIYSAAYTPALGDLATYFGAPLSAEDVAGVRRAKDLGPLSRLAETVPAIAPPVCRALEALMAPDTDAEAISLFNTAYCRLFLGMSGSAGAPPFESAYQGSGRLFQAPAREMKRLLKAYHLAPVEGFVEPPDHIAIELSLLEQLSRLDATLADVEASAAITALRGRLATWVPAFADACIRFDASGLYAALGEILVLLLDDDLALAA